MKKIVLLLLLSVFAKNIGFSQHHALGARYAYLVSFARFDQNNGQEVLTGLSSYGLSFLHFTKTNSNNFKLGTSIGLNLTEKGWKREIVPNYTYQKTYQSLEIPFLSKFYFSNNNIGFSINAGVHAGLLLSAKEKLNTISTSSENEYVFNKEYDNRIEFGIDGGISLYYNLKFGLLSLDAGMAFGISNYYKRDVENFTNVSNVHNVSLALSYLHYFKLQNKQP